MTERESARAAAILAFRARVTGSVKLRNGLPILGNPAIEYGGDFPYESVANCIDLPRDFTDKEIAAGTQKDASERRTNIHAPCWRRFFQMFDEEWSVYQRENSGGR